MNFSKWSLMIALCSAIFFSECKKGDGDPVLTLRTRKERLTGTWYITRGYAAFTSYSPNAMPNNFNFEFYDNKALLTGSNYSNSVTLPYTLSLNFQKDGKFRVIENVDGDILNSTGFWNFTAGVGKTKNKEEVNIRLDAVVTGDTQEHIFNNFSTEVTYKLKQLRNKEIIISVSRKAYVNAYGEKGTYAAEYTLIQKTN